jgi:Zn-dependent protease with chaperone function
MSTTFRTQLNRVRSVERAADIAVDRQPWACLAGLLAGWSALFVAVWVAGLFALIGALAGFFGFGFLTVGVGQASQGAAVAGALAGFAAGFVTGFATVYGISISQAPVHVLISLGAGLICALIITLICVTFEPLLLDLRSYRRPSRRPEEAKLLPMLIEVARQMGLSLVPPLRIVDSPVPGAWTHLSHIVLSKGLITQMDDGEISAVLAHELHHWTVGDPLALRFVWGCAFPLVVLVNVYDLIRRRVMILQKWTSIAGFFVWPALLLLRFVVTPLMIARGRTQEYEADAAAIAAGYGPALASALSKLQDFEVARTGWEEALLQTHPPIEFRLEAIEEAAAG